MPGEKPGSAKSWTNVPTRVKKFIYSIVAIVVALTVLLTKFDELVDTWNNLWAKLFPPGLDYVEFVIDSSTAMDGEFDDGQNKWISLVSAVRTSLPLFDPKHTAVRTYGGACLDPTSTRMVADFGNSSTEAIEQKVAEVVVQGEEAPLYKALAETINDLRKQERFSKTDPSLTNRIIVISGGAACDYNEMSFRQLKERMLELGIRLEFSLIGMKAEGLALQQLSNLAKELDTRLYAVDRSQELLNAVEAKQPVDAFTKAKEYYESEQDSRALPLLDMYENKPEAMVMSGNIHANMNNPNRDEAKAVALYRRAGTAGNGEAWFQLGNIYSEKALQDSARVYWEKAVDLGFDRAKDRLKELTAAK